MIRQNGKHIRFIPRTPPAGRAGGNKDRCWKCGCNLPAHCERNMCVSCSPYAQQILSHVKGLRPKEIASLDSEGNLPELEIS